MTLEEQQIVPVAIVANPLDDYRDIDKELDDLIDGNNASGDLASLIEKHQIRVTPQQRRVLLYLMGGTPRMVRYAYKWLDLAGREGNSGDFIRLQEAMTFSIPEMNRNLTMSPMPPPGR